MFEDDNPSNVEWEQDKGFSDTSRKSRRIDLQKEIQADAKERNSFKTSRPAVQHHPANLKKLRKKIRDVYDEEDDDEEEIVIHFSFEDDNSSLIDALRDEEKNKLQFNKTLENQKMQQTAGKMEAILMADKMSKQLGLKGLKNKIVQQNIQDINATSDVYNNAVSQNVSAKTRLNAEGLSAKDSSNLVKGLKKLQSAALATDQRQDVLLESVKTEDLIKIGKTPDDKKAAKLILEKSGRQNSSAKKQANIQKNKQKIKTAVKQATQRD